jgi:hypothetical protein
VPYLLVALLASVVLAARYVALAEVSRRSKALVALAVAGSVLIWWALPEWDWIATLAQVGVSIYVLVSLKGNPHAA